LTSITAIPIYLFLRTISKNTVGSLLGTAIFLFAPIALLSGIKTGHSIGATNNFFLAIAVFSVFFATQKNNKSTRALAITAIATLPFFLIENLIPATVLFVSSLFFWKYDMEKIRKDLVFIGLLIASSVSLLLVVYWNWIQNSLLKNMFSIEFFAKNTSPIFLELFSSFWPFSLVFPIAIIIALTTKKTRKKTYPLIAWIFFCLLLFSFFELGGTDRYFQILLIPISAICTLGIITGSKKIREKTNNKNAENLIILIMILLIALPVIGFRGEDIIEIEKMKEAIDSVEQGDNLFLFTNNNTVWAGVFILPNEKFSTIFRFEKKDFEKTLFFVDTGRCDDEFWASFFGDRCQMIKSNSELEVNHKNIKIYRIKKEKLYQELND